jgi:hypothetical protein
MSTNNTALIGGAATVGVAGVATTAAFVSGQFLIIVAICAGIAALACGGVLFYTKWQEKRRAKSLNDEVKASGSRAPRGVAQNAQDKAKLDDLGKKFSEGVIKFQSAGKDLYSVPWYLMIGPPGSGKTEAVRHSRLKFASGLQDKMQGVGGTYSMNWWFTNDAVILDTAGRIIMEDTKDWESFLKMLKKTRPREPVNGLILAIDCNRLKTQDAGKLEADAEQIARQLETIQRALGVRFPVYVLVTMCDKLPGFRTFFNDMQDPQQQNQMLGWSNQADLDTPFVVDELDEHFRLVRQRLVERRTRLLLDPVHTQDPSKRRTDEVDALYAFPNEMMLLLPRLKRWLEIIFTPGEWSPKPLFLRGIYFNSAMQQGEELDEGVARALGKSMKEMGESAFVNNVSYFINHMLTQKAFQERGLVTDAVNISKWQRRSQLLLIGGAIATCLAIIGISIWSAMDLKRRIQDPTNFWSSVASKLTVDGQPAAAANGLGIVQASAAGPVIAADLDLKIAGVSDTVTPATLAKATQPQVDTKISGGFLRAVAGENVFAKDRAQAFLNVIDLSAFQPVVQDAFLRLARPETWEQYKQSPEIPREALKQLLRLHTLAEGKTPRGDIPELLPPGVTPVAPAPKLAAMVALATQKTSTADLAELEKKLEPLQKQLDAMINPAAPEYAVWERSGTTPKEFFQKIAADAAEPRSLERALDLFTQSQPQFPGDVAAIDQFARLLDQLDTQQKSIEAITWPGSENRLEDFDQTVQEKWQPALSVVRETVKDLKTNFEPRIAKLDAWLTEAELAAAATAEAPRPFKLPQGQVNPFKELEDALPMPDDPTALEKAAAAAAAKKAAEATSAAGAGASGKAAGAVGGLITGLVSESGPIKVARDKLGKLSGDWQKRTREKLAQQIDQLKNVRGARESLTKSIARAEDGLKAMEAVDARLRTPLTVAESLRDDLLPALRADKLLDEPRAAIARVTTGLARFSTESSANFVRKLTEGLKASIDQSAGLEVRKRIRSLPSSVDEYKQMAIAGVDGSTPTPRIRLNDFALDPAFGPGAAKPISLFRFIEKQLADKQSLPIGSRQLTEELVGKGTVLRDYALQLVDYWADVPKQSAAIPRFSTAQELSQRIEAAGGATGLASDLRSFREPFRKLQELELNALLDNSRREKLGLVAAGMTRMTDEAAYTGNAITTIRSLQNLLTGDRANLISSLQPGSFTNDFPLYPQTVDQVHLSTEVFRRLVDQALAFVPDRVAPPNAQQADKARSLLTRASFPLRLVDGPAMSRSEVETFRDEADAALADLGPGAAGPATPPALAPQLSQEIRSKIAEQIDKARLSPADIAKLKRQADTARALLAVKQYTIRPLTTDDLKGSGAPFVPARLASNKVFNVRLLGGDGGVSGLVNDVIDLRVDRVLNAGPLVFEFLRTGGRDEPVRGRASLDGEWPILRAITQPSSRPLEGGAGLSFAIELPVSLTDEPGASMVQWFRVSLPPGQPWPAADSWRQ